MFYNPYEVMAMKILRCTLSADLKCEYRKDELCSIQNGVCGFSKEPESQQPKSEMPVKKEKWFEKYYR